MKKQLIFMALLGVFALMSTSSLVAQNKIANTTDCPFTIKIGYGELGTCDIQGYVVVTVNANSSVAAPIPPGTSIIVAKGTVSSPDECVFYVGVPCSPYPLVDFVPCAVNCGSYTASLDPTVGLEIN